MQVTNKMNIVMIGLPGSGKGTQAIKLANKYGLKHITSGELLREEATKDTETGDKIRQLMKTGELFPDNLVNKILKDNVPKENYILDGYPRKISQVHTFDDIDLVIYIVIPDEVAVERILNRDEGRVDDNKEAAKKRIKCFHSETEKVLEYYADARKLVTVDGNQDIESVFNCVVDEINKKYQ